MLDKGQLYFNGSVHTMDAGLPLAEAAAVRDGKILAVGGKSACITALGKGYEQVDLRGGALLPGFIDTHLHPVMVIFFALNCDLGDVTSIAGLQKKMRDSLAAKKDDTWLAGLNFDEQSLSEKRVPDRHDLDAVTTDRPVIVVKHDGHSLFANGRAMEVAGITASTPDPADGTVEKDEKGIPTGVFREGAVALVTNHLPLPDMPVLQETARGVFRRMLSLGLTSLGVILQTGPEGPTGSAGAYDTMAMELFSGDCPLSLYSLLIPSTGTELEALRGGPLNTGPNRLGGIKLFCDGTLGSSTAYMDRPFSDGPGKTGMLMHPAEELYRLMAQAHNGGWQVCIHSIGDKANRLCAELYDRLFKEFPRAGCRHRIEHASVIDLQTVRELVRLGIAVSAQPMFIHSEKGWLHPRLGPERCKITYPFRTFLEEGVRLAGASDAPVELLDVLHAIMCCVTREGFEPQQGITVEQALRMYTIEAAWVQFEEEVKGSITPGKRADLVVLAEDPYKVKPDRLKDIQVVRTVAGGRTVYS